MDLFLPEKKLVATLLEIPQTLAVEIRIDRIDLMSQRIIDVEDMVLWVQVMDLPCMEMLPYQRERFTGKIESISSGNLTEDQLFSEDPSYTVKLTKKTSTLVAGEPDANLSDTDNMEEEQIRKLRDKRKTVYRKERIKRLAKKHGMFELKDEAKRNSAKGSLADISRKKSGSRSLSFKEGDVKKVDLSPESGSMGIPLEESSNIKSKDTIKDEDSVKKFKLLTQFIGGSVPDDAPEGIAFNSDCCILIPCPSVANILYKMERMPIIIYVMELSNSCTKVIGKICFPMTYCFQEAVVKAAKLKGGVVTHAVEQSFPVYKPDDGVTSKIKVGHLFGSITLICYGRFGMTEIKSPGGDLMTGRLREWKADLRDLSQGLGGEGINLDEQPYGFKPTITRNLLPPPNSVLCPSTVPIESMFDFIQNYHDPSNTTNRLKTLI